MSSTPAHPRRRPARANSPSMTPSFLDSFQNMSIRSTFHNPSTTSKDELWDPLASIDSLSMPGRSTTCPKALEDLLIGAGERRTVELLARVDKAIEIQSKLALCAVLNEPEVLPLPSFTPNRVEQQHDAAKQRAHARTHRNSHSSDSGIGSSVAGSIDAVDLKSTRIDNTTGSSTNQSFSGISAASEERGLSKYASKQIHKHIIEPILREEALKEFHPLIESVPDRIGQKEIKNLRDLEKTLIFLAPDHSCSPSKYLRFCERTIRVLHTTVTTLHESDQRAPADRPYTQGYFLDLVEQIRRYATILAATREKQAKGEKMGEMDYSPDESVSLQGGVTHNGKAPELVRHKSGKAISLATGQVVTEEDVASASMKRPMSDLDANHDDVLRSMARRKKGAKPEVHECHLCEKEFKRPCDLTKHVKTHERPWKCPEDNCKFHEHGWPTEKERDRHVNDKHSSAPSLYHCLFKPCPYTSKRESNCKQHMEKTHGWEYVRSKSNGKGQMVDAVRLQRGSVARSPASSMLTPLTPIAPSPSIQSLSSSSRHESMPPPAIAGSNTYGTFTMPSPDFAGHFNMNFNFNDMTSAFPTPALSDDHYGSSTSSYSGLQLDGSAFEDAISPQDLDFGNDFDFNNFTFQQPSSYSNANAGPSSAAMPHNLSVDSGFAGSHAPHTSPGAQLDQTFTSTCLYDSMNLDEGYAGDFAANPNADFTLFGTTGPATTGGEMFPSLPAEGSRWGNFGGQFDAPFDLTTPNMPTSNSVLDELFPGLKGQ